MKDQALKSYPKEPTNEEVWEDNLWSEIEKAIEHLLNHQPPKEFVLYTSGTGIPDETWIEYYKDTNVPIITRDGMMWRKGERVE